MSPQQLQKGLFLQSLKDGYEIICGNPILVEIRHFKVLM